MAGVRPMAWNVFFVLLFPGLLFTTVAGLAATWVDRKVTARLQWRVGPPLAQPLWDILKLMGKEVILPRGGNHGLFLAAPLAKASGGAGKCGAVYRDASDADYRAVLQTVASAVARQWAEPRRDVGALPRPAAVAQNR